MSRAWLAIARSVTPFKLLDDADACIQSRAACGVSIGAVSVGRQYCVCHAVGMLCLRMLCLQLVLASRLPLRCMRLLSDGFR